jgi:hypothetical protein
VTLYCIRMRLHVITWSTPPFKVVEYISRDKTDLVHEVVGGREPQFTASGVRSSIIDLCELEFQFFRGGESTEQQL